MKHTRRVFSVLLALILALGLAVPALAEGEPDPAMPVITAQPQSVTVKSNEIFTLTIAAEIPNGDEVGYQWYMNDLPMPMPVSFSDSFIALQLGEQGFDGFAFYCVVYNLNDDTKSVTSETITVTVERKSDEKAPNQVAQAILDVIYFPNRMLVRTLTRLGVSTDSANTIAFVVLLPWNILVYPVLFILTPPTMTLF